MKHEPLHIYLRLSEILGDPKADPPTQGLLPISKSAWWDGIKERRYPAPYKIGKRSVAWRLDDIQSLLDSFERTL